MSLNESNPVQKVCTWKKAHPRFVDRNYKGVKYTQSWNRAGHICRNRLRLCANILSITSFPALQVCAWNVAHPALSERNNRGAKFTQPWNRAVHKGESTYEYISSVTRAVEYIKHTYAAHLWAGRYIIIFIVFFEILSWSHNLENVTSCSVSRGVRRTPSTPGVYALVKSAQIGAVLQGNLKKLHFSAKATWTYKKISKNDLPIHFSGNCFWRLCQFIQHICIQTFGASNFQTHWWLTISLTKIFKKIFFLLAARTYRFQFGITRFEDVTHSLKHDRRLPRCVVFCESNWILNKFELSELIAKSGDYLKLKIKFMYLSSICSFPSSKVKQQYFQHVFSVP